MIKSILNIIKYYLKFLIEIYRMILKIIGKGIPYIFCLVLMKNDREKKQNQTNGSGTMNTPAGK